MYLLDTDTVTAYLYGNADLAARLDEVSLSQISISIVTVAELLQGWVAGINRSQSNAKGNICGAYDKLAQAQEDLCAFSVMRFTQHMESVYQTFPTSVRRVGTNDCRIAATAIAHGLIVVTRNTRDFARIPGVKFEDWTAS